VPVLLRRKSSAGSGNNIGLNKARVRDSHQRAFRVDNRPSQVVTGRLSFRQPREPR